MQHKSLAYSCEPTWHLPNHHRPHMTVGPPVVSQGLPLKSAPPSLGAQLLAVVLKPGAEIQMIKQTPPKKELALLINRFDFPISDDL